MSTYDFAYDLDGTLVLTKKLNWEIYTEYLGIIPPSDFYKRSWQSWTTQEMHESKDTLFKQLATRDNVKATNLLKFARGTNGIILSMCSQVTISVVTTLYPEIFEIGPVHYAMTKEEKLDWLKTNSPGIYVDDDPEMCRTVSQLTEWCALSPHTVVREPNNV